MANFRPSLMAVAVSAALSYQPGSALAQQGDAYLEEVYVSARKREESILKVPVVLNALTEQQLNDFATSDLYEIADSVPGLIINNSVLGIGAQVSLRGIGTNVFDPTIDQSVSLIVDGMQMTQGTAYQSAFFDMQQVEILKGPQALFFGKASPGGVINVNTMDPTEETEVILKTGYETEAETVLGEFIVSGPITDTLGMRLALQYSDSDGYFRNIGYATAENEFTGGRTPESEDLAQSKTLLSRLTLVWEPTDTLRARFKYNHTDVDIEGDAGSVQPASCPEGIRDFPTGLTFNGNAEDCKLDDKYAFVHMDPAFFPGFSQIPGFEDRPGLRNNGVPFTEHQQDFGTLEFNWEFADSLELTSVTGFYDTQQSSMINASASSGDAPPFGVDPDFERSDLTQELRLTSNFDSPFNFMFGGFIQDSEMEYFNNLLGNPLLLGGLLQINQGTQTIDIDAKSLFGQVIWQVTPELELSAGTRWTDEERELTAVTWMCQPFTPIAFPEGCIPGSPVAPTEMPVKTPKISSDNYSPEYAVTWTPTDNLTLFATYKEAYKSGSYNTVTMPAAYVEETSYGDEHISGGELGLKSRLFDDQLSLNLAYYDYDYEDMQVGANDNTGGVVSIIVQNAASATVSGFEADFVYTPAQLPGFALRGAANWNDSEFDDFPNAQCWGGQSIEEGCDQLFDATSGLYNAQDISGKSLPRAPDFSANFGFDYELPVFRDSMIFRVSSTIYYSDEYLSALQHRPDMIQDSYTKSNLSFSLRDADDAWEVALIANNIEDEITAGNCSVSATEAGVFYADSSYGFPEPDLSWAQEDELLCTPDKGRQIWLQLTMRPMVWLGR